MYNENARRTTCRGYLVNPVEHRQTARCQKRRTLYKAVLHIYVYQRGRSGTTAKSTMNSPSDISPLPRQAVGMREHDLTSKCVCAFDSSQSFGAIERELFNRAISHPGVHGQPRVGCVQDSPFEAGRFPGVFQRRPDHQLG